MKGLHTFFLFITCIVMTVQNTPLNAQQYCYPDVQMACFYGDKIVNVNFAGINHTDNVCDVDGDGIKDFTTSVNAAQVTAGSSYTISVGVENSLPSGTERIRIWIDFNHDYIFQDTESIEVGVGTGNTTLSTTVAIPANAVPGTTRMRVMYRRTSANTLNATDACHSYGNYRGQLKDYAVTINASSNCTAALNPGNTISTLSAACPNETFTLSLQTTVSGTTYQWQKSGNGTNWNAISGGINSTLTTSQTTASYYRCQVSCEGNSSYSNPVFVTSNGPAYTALPVTESFDTWSSMCGGTTNVPGSYWLTTPVSGNNAFRRNDQGASATWANPTTGMYTPAASHGNYSARFHASEAANQSSGTLDLFIDCSTIASQKQLTFDYINPDGNDYLKLFISTDGGITFQSIGTTYTVHQNWETYTVAFSSGSPTTILRFEATADHQTSDIGLDNVHVETLLECSEPVSLTATSITHNTAQTYWTAPNPVPSSGYEYVLNTLQTAPTGSGTSYTTTSINHYNLSANTTYYFHVRSYCGGGEYSDWETVSFTTLPMPTTGIDEQTIGKVMIYPNPAKDRLHLELNETISVHEVVLMNTAGQVISTMNDHLNNSLTLPLDLENGMYLLIMHTNKGVFSRSFIVNQ